ncbi:polysaccharide biosynthesis protein [Rhodospirillum centenum]|uniref:Polysaccharide biosynthesis protein CapD, putative n=1 Tax=Rhodospirillum centenum (strain ATCC 51521 / SW) TaxID=414684 RepID=B6IMY1_RHOCS|nr:nucleoside-diphosphate sugar epimerase/dehydratase [Rhodospirillum centenum]ACI98878.1 polysaccharide biosynthesis protein CapD, putative [Rhodospirillum centenum SW]
MNKLTAFARIPLTDRRTLAYAHDILMAAGSFVLSLYLRVGSDFMAFLPELWPGLLIFTFIAAVSYRVFGMNSGVWRYASLRDLLAIMRAVTATILIFLMLLFLVTRLELLPRSMPVINWFVLVVMLGGPRLVYRILKDRRIASILEMNARDRIPVLLVGAGDEAELFIRAMQNDREAAYRVVGILDDKGGRIGREIHGVKVLGRLGDLPQVIADLTEGGDRPRRLILTRPQQRLTGVDLGEIVERCEALNLMLARLPDLTEFKDAKSDPGLTVRPIQIEDLLGRPQVALDKGAMGDLITGRVVLVTGAGGTIGSELTRQIAGLRPKRLVMVDHGEFNLYSIDLEMRESFPDLCVRAVLADVRDRARITQIFREEAPELVFHAAALKHVPMVELNPVEGVLTNVMGTRNVADAATAFGCLAMVLISTDKAVSPTNVMGATKRVAESYCQALDLQGNGGQGNGGRSHSTRFMTVRFGNVLGSTGSVVPLFTRQLRAGGPLTVTHPDVCRFFMTVREAVELVLQASAFGIRHRESRGRIFVLDMGQPVRIVDLARQMIRLAGLRPDKDIRIVFTGLRPGEKLYEEMFDAAEPPVRTDAEGVLVASPRAVDFGILNRSLDELDAAAHGCDVPRLLALLQHIVPGFVRQTHPALLPQAEAADGAGRVIPRQLH